MSASPIIIVGRLLGDGAGRSRVIIRIAELHDIEGGTLGLFDVEVIATAIGIDRHIGMDAPRDGLDREGLSPRNAVDFKAFCVACNDGADAFPLTKFHSGHMCQRHTETIDLRFLIGCKPDAAVIGSATRNGFSNG